MFKLLFEYEINFFYELNYYFTLTPPLKYVAIFISVSDERPMHDSNRVNLCDMMPLSMIILPSTYSHRMEMLWWKHAHSNEVIMKEKRKAITIANMNKDKEDQVHKQVIIEVICTEGRVNHLLCKNNGLGLTFKALFLSGIEPY